MRTFECPVSDRESFIQKLIVREGLPVPDVYGRADLMFTLAKVVKAEAREAFVFLPFDHVTEVAALGGRIHTGDESAGKGRYIFVFWRPFAGRGADKTRYKANG